MPSFFVTSCCVLLLTLATASFSKAVFAQAKQAETAAKLVELKKAIRSLEQDLAQSQGQKSSLEKELKRIEKRSGQLNREIKDNQQAIRNLRQQLTELREKNQSQLFKLDQQKAALSKQLLAAFKTGKQPGLKLLLNQTDPAIIGRTLGYYDYFSRAHRQKLHALQELLAELLSTQQALRQKAQAHEQELANLQTNQQDLSTQRKARKRVLRELRVAIKSDKAELSTLHQDEKRLQQLYRQLQEIMDDLVDTPKSNLAFNKLRGKLPLPIKAKVTKKFGETHQSRKFKGTLFKADYGTPIYSISHGRIAFSEWYPRFGLLVIIDHGNGYMSLYGHNESLYKEAGDWVEAGEKIATSGDTGGLESAHLYFEIRHNNEPLDPLKWCKRT